MSDQEKNEMSPATAAIIEQMQQQIADLQARSESAAQDNEALKAETAALKKALAAATAPTKPTATKSLVPEDTFEVDGTKYRFRVPRFRMPIKGVLGGAMITAVDALADKELLEFLVTNQSGVIEPA